MISLSFPPEATCNAIICRLIKKFDVDINILRASVDFNAHGFLLIEITGSEEALQQSYAYLDENQVDNVILNAAISINQNRCVNCGACTAVCKVSALVMNKDAELTFDNAKCLDCKICVTACPARAIEAVF